MNRPKYILLTKTAIREMFDECNRQYFNNSVELPIRVDMWTPQKKIVAMVRPIWSNRHKRTKAALHISSRYRWTEHNLRKVILHEMIHLAIGDYKEPLTFIQRLPLVGRFFITQHDDRFITLMNELNTQYNLGITVRAKQMRKEFIR